MSSAASCAKTPTLRTPGNSSVSQGWPAETLRQSLPARPSGPDPADYTILIRANSYYSFALLILLALGLVFELPVFVVGLVRIGVLTSTTLRRHRRLGYSTMAGPAIA